ncbi:cell wall hydrolase [Billgrantia endophytica]|uniref:Cell wall hydrolase n=1 Tax=Billgrantia endophytica TaxID=2033802 RepID=A0A2N7U7X6_9GAMM|nr:cell wall hydrolase [Halomonas endophytica]PMR76550.1 cell wall hydrolase [Halomonas endophytica]
MRKVWVVACLSMALLGSQSVTANQERMAEAATGKAESLEQAVVTTGGEASPSPAEVITEAEAQAVDPTGEAPLDETLTCLARTIYWEAKGVADADMEAVANVVMNRLGHAGFPDTVCAVVTQGSEHGPCQFSWWCDGRPDHVVEEDAYAIAREVARKALNQQLPDHTDGALYFHDRSVTPHWTSEYLMTAETDDFFFYKPHDGSAQ